MWEKAFINEYGDVFFCSLCKPKAIGNIYKQDLAYVWQKSRPARLFRQMSLNGGLICHFGCPAFSEEEKEVGLGRFYRNRGKLDKAEAALKDALKINPKNHYIYYELGWLYKDQGRYAQAEASFRKELELEPRDLDAYIGIGCLAREQKKYAQAEALFQKALKLNPESHAAYAELGWLYKDLGNFIEAETSFKKSLDLNPNTESACVGLGCLYKEQGRINQAKPLLRKALELNPRNIFAQEIFTQINKGADLVLYELGNTDYPRALHIVIAAFCPMNCITCPQQHHLKTILNSDVLKRNIDWSRIDDITIQGNGVSGIPGAKELCIWLTEKMRKKVKLVTSGLLVNRECARQNLKRRSVALLKNLIFGNFIHLEASTLCQLKCPECIQNNGEVNILGKGYLKFRDFKKFMEVNPCFKIVELSNYGEIFLNPELKDIIKYAYQNNIALQAYNGVNLNTVSKEMLECLVRYRFRAIRVSIDGASQETYRIYRIGGDFHQVIENIKSINFFKHKYRSRFPELFWQFVIFGHNEQELNKASNLAQALNMRFIPTFNWNPAYSPLRNKELVKKRMGFATWIEHDDKTDSLYMNACSQLWRGPQVNWDGRLLGCCVNHWSDFGNVFKTGFKNYIQSERYIYAKKMLLGLAEPRIDIPCSHCFHYRELSAKNQHLRLYSLLENYFAQYLKQRFRI